MKTLRLTAIGVGMGLLAGCMSAPKIVPGKGAVYGVVKAASHKDMVEKAAHSGDPIYSIGGKINYTQDMINYPELKELYVCLVDPKYQGGREHRLATTGEGMSLRSLAVALGDTIRIKNQTPKVQNFYMVDRLEGIQVFPPIPPGKEESIAVRLKGILELESEDDENLVTTVLSKPGLIPRRVGSGTRYSFEKLDPGTYSMIFWFWRLGAINKQVIVAKEKNTRIDQVLSVDQIIQNK
ncbi:MAG: hypothetical protein OEM27_08690 [Nitrospinota bacterium]|nr:hypothetical protein [Nitrospinota bacterium]